MELKIVRELMVEEVAITRNSDGSYRLKLDRNGWDLTGNGKATIILSKIDLERLRLDYASIQPWGLMVCTFTSRERSYARGERINPKFPMRAPDEIGKIVQDEVKVDSVTKTESFRPIPGEQTVVHATHRLKLQTPTGGGMYTPLSIPYYDFEVELTPVEYDWCKTLDGTVVFGLAMEYRHADPPKRMTRSEMARMSAEPAIN